MRLTKYHRDQIEQTLLRRRFAELFERVRVMKAKFGLSIYKKAFTARERETLAGLPHGWVPTTCNISAAIRGDKATFTLDEPVPIPHDRKDRWDNNVPLILVDQKENLRLLERFEAIRDEERRVDKARETAVREIRAVLAGLNTTKQLKDHWPEIGDIVDDIAPERDKVSRALVVRTEKINEILGLAKLRPHLMEETTA